MLGVLSYCRCLSQDLHSKLQPQDVFGHWELLDTLNRENEELGLIIDLTFTTRYYKIQVLHIKFILATLLSISVEECKETTCVFIVWCAGRTEITGVFEDLHKGARSTK